MDSFNENYYQHTLMPLFSDHVGDGDVTSNFKTTPKFMIILCVFIMSTRGREI